ncbi:hypothetical protein AGMMS49949_07360 [Alphaproteobacteria bacterium]|nr:hypothetical protein AGMMS49949_07360 [Alphaproteobacteria bacterium]
MCSGNMLNASTSTLETEPPSRIKEGTINGMVYDIKTPENPDGIFSYKDIRGILDQTGSYVQGHLDELSQNSLETYKIAD